MALPQSIKVAIDASVIPGTSGGIAPAVMSLVYTLGKLHDGSENYIVIVRSPQQFEWLKPILGPNQQLAMMRPFTNHRQHGPGEPSNRSFPELLKRALGPLLPAGRYLQKVISPKHWPEVPLSDGFYESLGCDVLHIPTHNFVLCALPTIYNPHDLQHLHYPQFWTPSVMAWRETIYPAGCHFAHTVVVGSQWTKDDIIRHYRVHPDKVQVIPEAPPTQLYSEPSDEWLYNVRKKYQLEQPFALFPAVTWPHKNHIRLLEALAYIRDKSALTIRLVCTGSPFENFWPRIAECVEELNLGPQIRFLGFVPEEDLRAVYRLSQFLIMPTLFEASSLPIFEAWLEGVPVACSNAAALPDQVMDAALLFDPNDVDSIAHAIADLSTNLHLQQQLRQRGSRRLQDFDLQRTAKAYRAVYRRAAGYPLTEEDRWLLMWDWMREPQKEKEARL